jgi:deazaflavin-dependent oxidoreductase (nitroreductase family)
MTALLNPVAKALLGAGLPLGANALVTIRGRTSGEPRTTPLAIIEIGGRRWVWSPWGDVNWVRNLRAAGRATITVRGHGEEVLATELDPEAQTHFFRDVFGPYVRSLRFGRTFIRLLDGVDVNDPRSADGHPVFELRPAG